MNLVRRCQEHRETFNVNKFFSLVPRFDPEKVELFFKMFEKGGHVMQRS